MNLIERAVSAVERVYRAELPAGLARDIAIAVARCTLLRMGAAGVLSEAVVAGMEQGAMADDAVATHAAIRHVLLGTTDA